jgi:superfamily II DNA/RNA helicase
MFRPNKTCDYMVASGKINPIKSMAAWPWASRAGLPMALARSLAAGGFPAPTALQALAVPKLLSGCDAVLCAETGSGKTLGM